MFKLPLLRVTMQRSLVIPVATHSGRNLSMTASRLAGWQPTTPRMQPYLTPKLAIDYRPDHVEDAAATRARGSRPTEQDWMEALDEGAEAKEAIRAFKEDGFALGENNEDGQVNVMEPVLSESASSETEGRVVATSFEG